MKKLILFVLALSLAGCLEVKTTVNTYRSPLEAGEAVQVIGPEGSLPGNVQFIGELNVTDNGLTMKCTYQDVITEATSQARAMGGNLVEITRHKKPGIWSTCHRIRASVYYQE